MAYEQRTNELAYLRGRFHGLAWGIVMGAVVGSGCAIAVDLLRGVQWF